MPVYQTCYIHLVCPFFSARYFTLLITVQLILPVAGIVYDTDLSICSDASVSNLLYSDASVSNLLYSDASVSNLFSLTLHLLKLH